MSASTDPINLRKLNSRIGSVWRRRQCLHFATGLLAIFRWAILMLIIGVAVDWSLEIPKIGRFGFLSFLVCICVWKAWHCGWKNFRKFNAAHIALSLEKQYGGLESLFVSAVQFGGARPVTGTSEAMRVKTVRLAEDAASKLQPNKAVPFGSLQRPAIIVFLLFSLIGLAAVANVRFVKAGLTRIFTPWVTAAYPTYTQLKLDAGDQVVKQGGPVRIRAQVQGVIPDTARLFLKTGDGRPRILSLEVVDGFCDYTINSASRNFTYRLQAGDARSGWHRVEVVAAPRIERVKIELDFPPYLNRTTETVEALTVTVPEGTELKWKLGLDRAVSKAELIKDGEPPQPLNVLEDGRSVEFASRASDSRGYSFVWVEKENGFVFSSPRYFLQVASDQPPQIELTSPANNLIAMLGRPIELVTLARDDYGIATASVAYQVNRRPASSIRIPPPPVGEQGKQKIDWDYRKSLADLKVGDTVSFTVEVSDRYPGADGPLQARSETRRVTFLSRPEYLAQIEEKKNRLLSYVRTLYRKERAAHDLVRDLNPDDESFSQSCQLEAIRQEMVRTQIHEIASEMQKLLDDLAVNNVADAPPGNSLKRVSSALRNIADLHVAAAAEQLRTLVGMEEKLVSSTDFSKPQGSLIAAKLVNHAARELGRLVLLRDIESAQEVFARETHVLAEQQAFLRWRTAQSRKAGAIVSETEAIAEQQIELSNWTKRLIQDLQRNVHLEKRPLAVLRLIRSVKQLGNSQYETLVQQTVSALRSGKFEQASNHQDELVKVFLDSEFSVRLTGAYSTLVRTRDSLAALVEAQSKLLAKTIALNQTKLRGDVQEQQRVLRKRLLLLLLPTAPAPRAKLSDEEVPTPPPIRQLRMDADTAMANSLSSAEAGDLEETKSAQRAAVQALKKLQRVVTQWSVESGLQTQGLATLVAASSERVARVEELEANVIALLDKTDVAAAEEKSVKPLADEQQFLIDELSQFLIELDNQQQTDPDSDLPPLVNRLLRAKQVLASGTEHLADESPDEALENQEQAADALAEAYAMAISQNERLSLLQDLLMFQRSVNFAEGYMADIVAEQRDLLVATDEAENGDAAKLTPRFEHLRRCMEEVAPLLDLVAARLDVGTPLAFAKTDFEDAIFSIQAGDTLDAIDAQDVAAESLGDVQQRIAAIQTQTGYVAEVVEFLHGAASETGTLRYRQRQLRTKSASSETNATKQLAQAQAALSSDVQRYVQQLVEVTGLPDFAETAEMSKVVSESISRGEVNSAIEQMKTVELKLQENAESIFNIISMLHGLPSIEITNQSKPELVRLIDVLDLASKQRRLSRQTETDDPDSLQAFAAVQKELAAQCQEIAQTGSSHELLADALVQLQTAVDAFDPLEKTTVRQAQKVADTKLRHFIVEQSLILETAKPPAAPSDGDPGDDGEGSDSESAFAAGFISDFVSGETPQDKRTGWKVLGDRNRASLNQNFARELPLEYRGLLKNYYERVAK